MNILQNSPYLPEFFKKYIVIFLFWEMIWKGLALWRAAQRNEKVWYILLLIINSVGILPIIYLVLDKMKSSKKQDPVILETKTELPNQ